MQNSVMNIRQAIPTVDSPVRILVVDDHPNTANMLARAISRLGSHVEVVSATSGSEAFKCMTSNPVDILITDMMMPGMTGLELIEKVNDQPTGHSIISFVITAHDSAELRESVQKLHIKQIIAKPVHPECICELITQTMEELCQSKSTNLKKLAADSPMHLRIPVQSRHCEKPGA